MCCGDTSAYLPHYKPALAFYLILLSKDIGWHLLFIYNESESFDLSPFRTVLSDRKALAIHREHNVRLEVKGNKLPPQAPPRYSECRGRVITPRDIPTLLLPYDASNAEPRSKIQVVQLSCLAFSGAITAPWLENGE